MKTLASMRPIQQIVLDMELVYLSMNYRTIRRFCEPKQITALFADAVHCYPSRCQREKLKSAAKQLRHPDGSAIFRLKDAEPKEVCTTEAPITEPFPSRQTSGPGTSTSGRGIPPGREGRERVPLRERRHREDLRRQNRGATLDGGWPSGHRDGLHARGGA